MNPEPPNRATGLFAKQMRDSFWRSHERATRSTCVSWPGSRVHAFTGGTRTRCGLAIPDLDTARVCAGTVACVRCERQTTATRAQLENLLVHAVAVTVDADVNDAGLCSCTDPADAFGPCPWCHFRAAVYACEGGDVPTLVMDNGTTVDPAHHDDCPRRWGSGLSCRCPELKGHHYA